MTETKLDDLFAVSAAHRLEMIRLAGRLTQRASEMSAIGSTITCWALDMEHDAQSLTAGIEALAARTEAARKSSASDTGTENNLIELFTVFSAHRLEMIRLAGRLAERAFAMRAIGEAGPTVARWALDMEHDAQSLAAGIEAFTARTDAAQDETQPISRSELAEANLADDD